MTPIPILKRIRENGTIPGITLNPDTPAEAIKPLLDYIDEVLFMTVFPGFGGQAFMPEVLPKMAEVLSWRPDLNISVDGGITLETAPQAARHGANLFVAGTSLYRADDMAADIVKMRDQTRRELNAAVN